MNDDQDTKDQPAVPTRARRQPPPKLERAAGSAVALGDTPMRYRVWQHGTWTCDDVVYEPGQEVRLSKLQVEAYGYPACLELVGAV